MVVGKTLPEFGDDDRRGSSPEPRELCAERGRPACAITARIFGLRHILAFGPDLPDGVIGLTGGGRLDEQVVADRTILHSGPGVSYRVARQLRPGNSCRLNRPLTVSIEGLPRSRQQAGIRPEGVMAKTTKPRPESKLEGSETAPRTVGTKKLIVGGAGAWFMIRLASADHGGRPVEVTRQVAFVDVGDRVVNLAPEPNQDRPRDLKLKVALDVKDDKIVSDVQPLMARVQDVVQVFWRELRGGNLEASGGIYRLSDELLRRVNLAVFPSRVDAVLFREVVVQ